MNTQILLSFLFLLCPLLSISFLKISKSKLINPVNVSVNLAVRTCLSLESLSQTTPSHSTLEILGSAAYFGVLAGPALVVSGNTKIIGHAGSQYALVGEVKYVAGGRHMGDAVYLRANADLQIAFDHLKSLKPTNVNNADLSGKTLLPGVYSFDAAATMNTNAPLTLDANGDANARWVFQVESSFVVSAGSQVKFAHGGLSKNVYWQVGSSAVIGANAHIVGNVIAGSSINFGEGASIDGRLLALEAAVIMSSNYVASVDCSK